MKADRLQGHIIKEEDRIVIKTFDDGVVDGTIVVIKTKGMNGYYIVADIKSGKYIQVNKQNIYMIEVI